MVFVHKKWEEFCKQLCDNSLISIPACEVEKNQEKYIILKHDVETNLLKALEIAEIEHKYGHRGSYYVQAYLLRKKANVEIMKTMQQMGHEISYHYDVMDSNHGDIDNAIVEFENNKRQFEDKGFKITTVCQHGNPVIERVGYTSNRDFFRSQKVQALYPNIADIMVDYKQKYHTNYVYYSDVGRRFTMIFDPINNDRINSNDKNIEYKDLEEVINAIRKQCNVILSIHPHRWTKSLVEYHIKNFLFKGAKSLAKMLIHIPKIKSIFNKYYYIAKKL